MPYQKCPLTKEGGGQQLAPHLPAPPSFRFGFIGLFCGLGVGMINWHSSKAKIVHGPVLGAWGAGGWGGFGPGGLGLGTGIPWVGGIGPCSPSGGDAGLGRVKYQYATATITSTTTMTATATPVGTSRRMTDHLQHAILPSLKIPRYRANASA